MFKNFKRSPSSSNPSQKIKFTNDQLAAGGYMRQGGDASCRLSPSPLQLVAVNNNNKSLPRRQASLRHSTYFGGSAALAYHPLASSPAPPQIGLCAKPVNTAKKYVSCDNIMGNQWGLGFELFVCVNFCNLGKVRSTMEVRVKNFIKHKRSMKMLGLTSSMSCQLRN